MDAKNSLAFVFTVIFPIYLPDVKTALQPTKWIFMDALPFNYLLLLLL